MGSEYLYLILVRLSFVSGAEIVAVDAFEAKDDTEAQNMARNLFSQERSGVVVYGGHVIFSDAICGLKTESIGVLDATNPENAGWVDSVRVFEKFLQQDLLDDEGNKD